MNRKVAIHIDLETVALTPKAAVVEIGAVYRDVLGELRMFHGVANPGHYVDGVREGAYDWDENTKGWHMRGNYGNWSSWCQCDTGPSYLAESFYSWLVNVAQEEEERGWRKIEIWTCGTDFDIPILTNLLRMEKGLYGKRLPWAYHAVRDYRTIRELYPEYSNAVPPNENKHGALSDASYQHAHWEAIMTMIGKGQSYGIPGGPEARQT